MKSHPSRRCSRQPLSIEPLEARISPAAVVSVISGNLVVNDANKNAGDNVTISFSALGAFQISDPNGISAGTGATQITSTTVDVVQATVTGILQVTLGEGTNNLQLSSGLPSIKGISVDTGTIVPLPALTVGSSGLQITVSGSDIQAANITSGGDVTLAATGAAESIFISGAMTFTGASSASVTVQASSSIIFTDSGQIANTVAGSSVILTADADSDGNGAIINGLVNASADVLTGSLTATAATGISLAFGAGSLSTTNTGANGISLVASGNVQVTSLAAHSGLITLGGGNFSLAAGTTLSPASALNVTGGSLDLGGTHQTLAGVTLTSGSILDGSLTTSALTAESGSIGASLAGSFTLVKTTSGIVTLSAANTYTGGTDISQGVLEFSNPGAFGPGKILLNDAATGSHSTALLATAVMNNAPVSGAQGAVKNAIIVQNFGSIAAVIGTTPFSGALPPGDNATVFSGSISLAAPVVFQGDNTELTDFAGTISGNAGTMTIAGTSPVELGGKNGFTAGVTVNDGILLIHSDAALGVSANSLTFDQGELKTAGLVTSDRAIDFAAGNTIIDVTSSTLTLNGPISGGGTFSKIGPGKLVLGSAFAGDVTVSGGSVTVAGATITMTNSGEAQIHVVSNGSGGSIIQTIDLSDTDLTTALSVTGLPGSPITIPVDHINVLGDIGLITLGPTVVLGDGVNSGVAALKIAGISNTLHLNDIAAYAGLSLGYDTPDPAANHPNLTIRNVLGPGVDINVAPGPGISTPGVGGGGLGRVMVNSWSEGGEINTTQNVGIGSFTLRHGDCFVDFNVDPAPVGVMLIQSGAWGGTANILGPVGTFSAEGFLSMGSLSADDVQIFTVKKNIINPTDNGYAGAMTLNMANDPLMTTFTIYGDFTGSVVSASPVPNVAVTGNFYGSLTAASIGNITAYTFNGASQNHPVGTIEATSGKLGTLTTSDGGIANYNIFVETKFAGFNVKDTALDANIIGINNVKVEAGDITAITVALKAGTALAGIQNSTFEASATALGLTFAGAAGDYTGAGTIGAISSSHLVSGATFSAWATIDAVTVGTVDLTSTLTNSMFLAGTSLGGDGVLGGPDADSFTRAGKITSVTVKGIVTGSTIAVGVDPNGTVYGNGDDTAAAGAPTAPYAIGALVFGAGSGAFTMSPTIAHDDAIEGPTIKSLKIGAGTAITNFTSPHYLKIGGAEAATDILVQKL